MINPALGERKPRGLLPGQWQRATCDNFVTSSVSPAYNAGR